MSNFEDKVVIVTGAASGFGQLLAERLSHMRARLVLGDINEARLRGVADTLDTEVVASKCDVTIESDVQALTELAVDSFGGLDIAVNNAGISGQMKSLLDTTEEDMDRCFAVNTKGVFFGMKHQIPVMLTQGGGCILNVASLAGLNGAHKLTAYVAAKHAVVGITKTGAVEFAKRNIRINAICPYFTPTPMVTDQLDDQVHQVVAQASPMKRLGKPEEIISAMLMMIDPSNGYMTGQAVAIDGGVSAI